MRIQTHISALVLVSIGGALGLAVAIGSTFVDLRVASREVGDASENHRKVQLLANRLGPTLSMMEIASEDPDWLYLLDPLIPRCESDLIGLEESEDFGSLAVPALEHFRELISLCRSFGEGEIEDETLDRFEEVVDELRLSVDTIHMHLQNSAELKEMELARRIQRATSSLGAAALLYFCGIALIYFWTTRRIVRPVRRLSRSADAAVNQDSTFSLDATGPDEIRQLARNFASLVQSLEGRVQERTAALESTMHELQQTNRTLEQANDRAESGTRAKSQFLANMSHEIRTPMTAVLGYAEILAENDLDPDHAEAVLTIRRNGEYLLSLINDLLDLSKIEADRIEMEHVAFSLADVIADVVSLMSVKATERRLDLTVRNLTPLPATITSDPTRIRQILINLVGNAIKFTEQGSVEIAVGVYVRDGKPALDLQVIDTGIGMNEEQRERLFQPFVQADASTSRRFGGTGLGLTISKRFAEMLGGTIRVESELGKGSRFIATIHPGDVVDVPLADRPLSEHLVHRVTEQPVDRPLPSLAGCHILLAEDTPTNQRLITHILEKAGATVDVAENGAIALEKLRGAVPLGTPFDLVVMDMQMPVVDGYEATRTLREEGFELPVIALTAHAMDQDRDRCRDAGCDDFASKPINKRALLEMLLSYSRGDGSPA